GFLYVGLMIINEEPFLIEYNVRMGDPECQTILPKLKTDFFKIIEACINQKLTSINFEWKKEKSVCIVLCSKGYPDNFENNVEIKNLNNVVLKNDEYIFHAGTKNDNFKIISNGGRVLNFVILSKEFSESRKKALSLIDQIDWPNGFFRKDIGHKVID
ncbi:phosphoribosylamine--glycine ligase, partial [Candidatus Pelagibacter sp.]|nr:phosphoribosylamine--glycine ligase [Candidatus Pelagibacter sp.]